MAQEYAVTDDMIRKAHTDLLMLPVQRIDEPESLAFERQYRRTRVEQLRYRLMDNPFELREPVPIYLPFILNENGYPTGFQTPMRDLYGYRDRGAFRFVGRSEINLTPASDSIAVCETGTMLVVVYPIVQGHNVIGCRFADKASREIYQTLFDPEYDYQQDRSDRAEKRRHMLWRRWRTYDAGLAMTGRRPRRFGA